MNRIFLTLLLTAILLTIGSPAVFAEGQTQSGLANTGQGSAYQLGAGDKVQIHVFGEDDLSLEVRLSDAGTISYPFLGELKVLGMTARGLETLIIRKLKGPYLVDPKVNISIIEYRPFFIGGEVKKPGGYLYQPGLTLRKAVSLAGGFTERAANNKVYVVRENDTTKSPKSLGLDDPIYPGDSISIERSFF